ncbi:hypothetical protein LA76x_2300 [Lysobacter antibioticus]|uniref:Uncharacterized protein n=1 Tax=Lysobacter antibioticus TaxID=84531 RepID=A0A0S2FA76_LYSAN|nr:hypothetical protein LA76x_2300 [Lysobacter antibioticus]
MTHSRRPQALVFSSVTGRMPVLYIGISPALKTTIRRR